MISFIIQAFLKSKFNPVGLSKKETTKNLWFALRRNQTKVTLSILYKASNLFLQKRDLIKENGK